MLMMDVRIDGYNVKPEIWNISDGTGTTDPTVGGCYLGYNAFGPGQFDLQRHKGNLNILYVDGHVDNQPILDTGSSTNNGVALGQPGNRPSVRLKASGSGRTSRTRQLPSVQLLHAPGRNARPRSFLFPDLIVRLRSSPDPLESASLYGRGRDIKHFASCVELLSSELPAPHVIDLSDQFLSELIGHGRPAKMESFPDDRRRVSRRRFGRQAVVAPASGESESVVVLREISASGVGFISELKMDDGQTFVIHLPTRSGTPVRVRCAVRHCQRGGSGSLHFVVGGAFTEILDGQLDGEADDVQAALAFPD